MMLVMLTACFIVLGATMSRTTTNAKLIDRNNAYIAATGAAEASTEKALAMLLSDFQYGAEPRVIANINAYRAAVPNSSESSYWANFQFQDATGNANRNFVGRTSLANNPVFVSLSEQYSGLSGFSSNYRIISNVKPLNSPYNVTATVQQDVQIASIPVFQFAVFYSGLMEYTWTAPFTVTGRVHCNSNIHVGSQSALTFNNTVTVVGTITNPPWDGHVQSDYTAKVTYNATPSPGFDTGYNTLTLPIGTNNTSAAVRQIIYPPATGEDPTSALGQERYWNEAGMIITVSNVTATNVVTNVIVQLSGTDSSPLTFTSGTGSWTNAGFNNSFITNVLFYDQRQQQMMNTTQIDVGKLKTWMNGMGTNSSVSSKVNAVNPLNGIVYVADFRNTNSSTNTAVRLADGQSLPTNGLTVATPNPLYILGYYNCPSNAFLGTTNTSASAPASIAADSLTILSPAWSDSKAANSSSTLGSRNSAPAGTLADTVNTAIIAGITFSTGSGSLQYSGGVNNLPRLLEDWSSSTLTLNTSIVNMYDSVWATKQFQNPGVYYSAPMNRNFNFDQNYTQAGKMPPGTPQVRRLIRASFCNPPPGVTNYVPQPTDFVPE